MRRRRALVVAALTVLLVVTGAAARHALGGTAGMLGQPGLRNHLSVLHNSSAHLPAVGWPEQGQAALVLGGSRPQASPGEQPVPIASVAKVMTAYLTLKRYPLSGAQDGYTITVTAAQAHAQVQDAAEEQSVTVVRPGERLTERQLLEALLIPSANNIARMLAVDVAGSEAGFVAEMNSEARALGMDHTVYTDPSGWDPGTVSTAADQLRVFRRAMRFPIFRQIVSMASVTLPVAGTVANTNPLVADGYVGKTGSDSAAGACLAFFTHVTIGGHTVTAVGVVLGQWVGSDRTVSLAAAGQAAQQLVASVAPQLPAPGGWRPDRRRRTPVP